MSIKEGGQKASVKIETLKPVVYCGSETQQSTVLKNANLACTKTRDDPAESIPEIDVMYGGKAQDLCEEGAKTQPGPGQKYISGLTKLQSVETKPPTPFEQPPPTPWEVPTYAEKCPVSAENKIMRVGTDFTKLTVLEGSDRSRSFRLCCDTAGTKKLSAVAVVEVSPSPKEGKDKAY